MSKGRHVKKRGLRTAGIVAAVVLGVLVLGGAAAAYAGFRYEHAHQDRILPGVRVAGVDVGGMTEAEATDAVQRVVTQTLSKDFTVSVGDEHWITTPAQLGRRAAVTLAVNRAFAAGGRLGTLDRAWHRFRSEPLDVDIEIRYRSTAGGVDPLTEKIAKSVYVAPRDASIGITDDGNDVVFIHAKAGAKLNVAVAGARISGALGAGRNAVVLRTQPVAPEVSDQNLGRTVVVRVDQNRLYLYDGFKVERTWSVATAKPGYTTPTGVWNIWDMRKDPTWYNPALDSWGAGLPAVVPGGPTAPMGTRAIYIDAPGLIRVHGTPDDSSIGRYASHGCIRMHNSEVEQLFDLLEVGEHVVIVGHRPAGASYWDTPGNADI